MGWPASVSMSTTTTIFVTAKQTWRSLDIRSGSISPLLHFHNLVGCNHLGADPTRRGIWSEIHTELQCFIGSLVSYKYQNSIHECINHAMCGWVDTGGFATSKLTGCSVWRWRKYLATFDQFPEDSEKPLNPAVSVLEV